MNSFLKTIAALGALVLSCASAASQTCRTPTGATQGSWQTTSYFLTEANQKLTNGQTLTGISALSPGAEPLSLKVMLRNSASSIDVVVNFTFAHPGGGLVTATLPTPFAIPATGDYYLGESMQNGNGPNTPASQTGQYAINSDLPTGPATVASGQANYPILCPVYSGGGGGGGGSSPLPVSTTLVLPSAGQSLIACYNGSAPYAVRHTGHVWSVNASGALVAVTTGNPAGCDGPNSTFLVVLADKILDDARFTDIVIVPGAVGGSYLADWATGGAHNSKLTTMFSQLSALGLSAAMTLFQWEQGTQDALTAITPATALARTQSIISTIRAAAPTVPIFWYLEARANGPDLGGQSVRAAERAVVNGTDIFQGPDMDTLGTEYRLSPPPNPHFADIAAQAALAKIPIDHYLLTH